MICSIALVIRICFEFYSRAASCKSKKGSCSSMLAINVAFNVIHWLLYWKMREDLRWTKYKAVGADPDTRRVYLRYELFSAMRKLDVQFSLIILVGGVWGGMSGWADFAVAP